VDDNELAELRALAEKATPGAWEAIADSDDPDEWWVTAGPRWFTSPAGRRQFGMERIIDLAEENFNQADAAFIAAARTAVPALLDQLAVQRAVNAGLVDARNRQADTIRELRDYLRVQHHVRKLHDQLGENLSCAGCALLGEDNE
jgi:hypothetical protein